MYKKLSGGNEQVLRLPVSPCARQRSIRVMKKLKLYHYLQIYVFENKNAEIVTNRVVNV